MLDLDRDGNPEIISEVTIEFKSPGEYFIAEVLSLVQVNKPTEHMNKIFNSVGILSDFNPINDEGTYSFSNAIDINGNGVAELILTKGHGEGGGEVVVFELRDGKLRQVCFISSFIGD